MEKKNKASESSGLALQMAIVFIVMFAYYLYSLLNYSAQVKENVDSQVMAELEEEGNKLVLDFSRSIVAVAQTAQAAAGAISVAERPLLAVNYDILEKIVNSSDAGYAYVADTEGNAVDINGNTLTIADTEDYALAVSGVQVISDISDAEGGRNMIAFYAPVSKRGNIVGVVCLQYAAEHFENLPKLNAQDGQTIYALMKNDGVMVSLIGSGKPENGTCLYDIVDDLEGVVAGSSEKKLRQAIKSNKSVIISCVINGVPRVISCRNTGTNGWYIVEMYTQHYYDSVYRKKYAPTGDVIKKLLIALFAFFVIVVAIFVFDKAFYNRKREELRRKAETDLLTGLYNKIATEKYISEYLREVGDEEPGMLFVIDVDNFKKVNDTMGHAFGDTLLATLGVKLKSQFRSTDIVGRIGGDEFMVYLKKIPNDEIRVKEADVMTTFFDNFTAGDYVKYSATASVGVAIYPDDGRSFEELYKAADKGVYLAKQRGKAQLAFYQETNGNPPPGAAS